MLWGMLPGQLVAVARAWEAELWETGERLRLLEGMHRGRGARHRRAGMPTASLRLRPSRA